MSDSAVCDGCGEVMWHWEDLEYCPTVGYWLCGKCMEFVLPQLEKGLDHGFDNIIDKQQE